MSSQKPKPDPIRQPAVEADDDLDDLDDVLDQFNADPQANYSPSIPSAPPPTASTTTTFHRPRTNTRVDAPPQSIPGTRKAQLNATSELDENALSAEFTRELSKGMESLMREIADSSGDTEGGEEQENIRAMKVAWEKMLVEGMNGEGGDAGLSALGELLGQGGVGPGDNGKSAEGGKSGESNDFQKKIKAATERLKKSESELQAGSGTGPESMENLLESLRDLGLGEGGDESELTGFLENMMGQLMSKDVLYEPLKELSDNFPAYLAKPPSPIEDDDRKRYEQQAACVKRIITVFEQPEYNDSDVEKHKVIVDLMSEMQSYGSPPAELMGPLPPGFEGMSQLGEDGCVIS